MIPDPTTTELAAAFLQAAITVGLATLCAFLFRRYHKPYFGYWALAWVLYAMRLAAIITFLLTANRVWLYWHQVTTGWTALAFLWAALVFSRQTRWRREYLVLVFFPPVWSYVAIYQMENFLLAASPAVLFLSLATWWAGWTFFQHHRKVRSTAAAIIAMTFFLWGLHHLDYPFLRARGAWNPWGYYLDIAFALAVGTGILLLVTEDLGRGLRTLSALSGDLQPRGRTGNVVDALLERPLTLAGVRGSALFLLRDGKGRFAGGAGACLSWAGTEPSGVAAQAISRAIENREPEIVHDWIDGKNLDGGGGPFAYAAALPVLQHHAVAGVLVIVGDARDPFAALDAHFLTALGQQVGAAIENADLYRRLEARTADLERLAARMVNQHEDERRRLSRELHDETAQVFSAVKMQLGIVRESAPANMAPDLDRALGLVDAGIRSIRNVTNDLRPSLLDDLGLLPALQALVDDFGENSGLYATLTVSGPAPVLDDDAELALFRALQEGLANVARHADATAVRVALHRTGASIVLELTDDGRGLPGDVPSSSLERNGHMGLAGMRERITRLGGSVALHGGPQGGAHLVVTIPGEGGPER